MELGFSLQVQEFVYGEQCNALGDYCLYILLDNLKLTVDRTQ